jgi:LacI family transcriptional regulator
MGKKKISLKDVADRLGVSKTLVSMVLNHCADENGISPNTQQRVWEKVKELDYQPNQMARGLRLGKSNTIGLVVSDISNPFYSKIARYIEDYVYLKGYNLIICSTDEDESKEISIIKMLQERQADGLIISTSQKSFSKIQNLLDDDIPFVLIDRYNNDFLANSITVDNLEGAYNAVMHLIKQGYRKIAAFAISPIHISTIRDRIDGYVIALKDAKVKYDSKLVREIPFNNVKNVVKSEIDSLINNKSNIDALFALNNTIALACLECFHEMKIRIPEDLAFVCFDDIELFKFNTPTITAVEQPIQKIGAETVKILLYEIKNGVKSTEKKTISMPTKLIIRESTSKKIT